MEILNCAYALVPDDVSFEQFVQERGLSMLHVAAVQEDSQELSALLQSNTQPHVKHAQLGTALHMAAAIGLIDNVRLLLAHGASAWETNSAGDTPLKRVDEEKYPALYALLKIAQTMEPSKMAQLQKDVIMMRQSCKEIEPRESCWARKPVLKHTHFAREPLSILVQSKNKTALEQIARLLDEGADINKVEGEFSPLLFATMTGDPDTALLLIARGARINEKGLWKGYTPLQCAAERGLVTVVKSLLAHGADITAKNEDGLTALTLAIVNKKTRTVELLTEENAEQLKRLKKQREEQTEQSRALAAFLKKAELAVACREEKVVSNE